jgi:hypothetical protein
MTHIVDLRHKKLKKRKKKLKSKKHQDASVSIEKIEWTAAEFVEYKKDKRWFFYAGLITIGLIIIAILIKNFLLAVIVLLAAVTVYIYSVKEPRKIIFSISGQGIQIDKQIYDFENLKSFWIFYNSEIKELSIRSKKAIMPYIKIPLGKQDPVEVRELLLKFLPEKKHQESVIDNWARRLRF